MCMESSAAWRNIAGVGSPAAGSELVEIFSRRLNMSMTLAGRCSGIGILDNASKNLWLKE